MSIFSKKFTLYVLIFIFSLFMANNSFAVDESKISSDFEKIVNSFEKFFSTNPLMLEKQSYKESPTGLIFFYNVFKNCEISYDIKKTESIISPYSGYILLKFNRYESSNCGDVHTYLDVNRFSTIELARANKDKESCYKPEQSLFKTSNSKENEFNFAFQKGKWVFKGVTDNHNKGFEFFLNYILGTPIPETNTIGAERYGLEDNNIWKTLLNQK